MPTPEANALSFVSKNLPTIMSIAKSAYGSVDSTVQIALRTAYTDYLSSTYAKYSRSRSFFIRDTPTDIYEYYVPARLSIGRKKTLTEPNLASCLSISNRLIISGTAGSGKSVLVKHLFLDCINSDDHAPILVELRDLNEKNCTLSELISNTLSSFNFNATSQFITKANKAGHFCYIFDGYDEVDFEKRSGLLSEINDLASKYSKCPIILSSRPEDDLERLQDFNVLKVLPLSLEQALALVNRLPVELEVQKKFCAELENHLFEQRKSFLSNPLLLSIMLLTYGENAEIPQKKSIFYSQAFEALFRRHDSYKGAFRRKRNTDLDSLDFSRVFAMFALQTYEKREFKLPKIQCLTYLDTCRKASNIDFNPEHLLQDIMKAFCLLVEDGPEIAYTHRSFQEYFVALHISMATPLVQSKLIERYWSRIKSDDVIDLLHEINPDLVERALLPKVEKIFQGIRVSNKVTPAAVVRYIKKTYKQINLNPDSINFVVKNDDISHKTIVLLVRLNHAYGMPGEQYFSDLICDLREQLCVADDDTFTESNISLNSPLTVGLVTGKGAFSVAYLQAAFDTYQALKVKHSQTIDIMNTLLGITE